MSSLRVELRETGGCDITTVEESMNLHVAATESEKGGLILDNSQPNAEKLCEIGGCDIATVDESVASHSGLVLPSTSRGIQVNNNEHYQFTGTITYIT